MGLLSNFIKGKNHNMHKLRNKFNSENGTGRKYFKGCGSTPYLQENKQSKYEGLRVFPIICHAYLFIWKLIWDCLTELREFESSNDILSFSLPPYLCLTVSSLSLLAFLFYARTHTPDQENSQKQPAKNLGSKSSTKPLKCFLARLLANET